MSEILNDKVNKKMLDFIKTCPRTPTEISNHLHLSREHTYRAFIKPLVELGKIAKVEGTDRYGIKGYSLDLRNVQRILAQDTKFDDCQTIQNWRANNNALHRETKISTLKRICLGKRKGLKDWKINPDSWIHPKDTVDFIAFAKEKLGVDELPSGIVIALRAFIIYGLKYNLSEAEGNSLGISGDKAEPATAHLEMKSDTYESCLKQLEDEISYYVKFGFSFHTFVRPAIRYTIKIDDLKFYDRTIKYAKIDDEIVTEPKILQLLKNEGIEIHSKTQRACTVMVFEYKTLKNYSKVIYDERIVLALEKFVDNRRTRGFKYLFWDNNNTVFNKKNYRVITLGEVEKDNEFFVELFFKNGYKNGDFGKTARGNYAIRHFGVQWWLQKTNYNYGLVSEMGWEDITTLRNWYGRMTPEFRDKGLRGVFI